MKKFIALLLTVIMISTMLPISTFAADLNKARLSVDSLDATPDDTVSINIKLENNPGIISASINVAFDEGLILTGALNGKTFPAYMTFTPPRQLSTVGYITESCNFVWSGMDIDDADIKDGTILTLNFKIPSDAQIGDKYKVTITGRSNDIVDKNMQYVDLETVQSEITVIDYCPGDVNDDGFVSMMDTVMISRYIVDGCKTDPNGYNIRLNEKAADVNADGSISMMDTVMISRYIVDGCKTDPNGYNITLVGGKKLCAHEMTKTEAKSATCTEAGNIDYWYCNLCNKYFADANGSRAITLDATVIEKTGHTVVIDPAVPATYEATGLTEGSHCSVCGTVIVKQEVVDKLEADAYGITYDIANGDTYLASLNIENPNPNSYISEKGLTLKNPTVPGYVFLGWYDLPSGNNAEIVKKIAVGETDEYVLYAHWEKIQYKVQYKSDVFVEKETDVYTVDEGLTLTTPRLSNYIFTCWVDDNGKLYDDAKIPVGTTGNITLTANWTSERNKCTTYTNPSNPIIIDDEENNMIYFSYEIGKIENVPLYQIKDFGYINGDGITKSETCTYTTAITEETMKNYSSVVANATTDSASWTLSKGWSDATSISEKWLETHTEESEEIDTVGRSETDQWLVSSGHNKLSEAYTYEVTNDGWKNETQHRKGYTENQGTGTNTELSVNIGNTWGFSNSNSSELSPNKKQKDIITGTTSSGVSTGVGGKLGLSTNHSLENEDHTDTDYLTYYDSWNVNSTNESESWNDSSSYGGSNTVSSSKTISSRIADSISRETGYGKTYISNEAQSNSEGHVYTQSGSEGYSNSTVYSKAESETVTKTWTTQGTKAGYHRWIVAGTMHVFAVVGYDMETKSFFVTTQSIMDDQTHEFEDYSYTTASYNDNQNGAISFEVPTEIAEYVASKICFSDGLKINQKTGIIADYFGSDNCVIIPEKMSVYSFTDDYGVDHYDIINVKGISASAFAGNNNISAVFLPDRITEIPAKAFENCSELIAVCGNGINTIGDYAFYGCEKLLTTALHDSVTSLGKNAFFNVDTLIVNAANANVAKMAAQSKAKNLYIGTSVAGGNENLFDNAELVIPAETLYFEFNGYSKTFNNFVIDSSAAKTTVNKITINANNVLPLRILSEDVVLNQVNISSCGLGMVLDAESTNIRLQGNVEVSSKTNMPVLCRNISLDELNQSVVGNLEVNEKIYVNGTVDGQEYLARKGEEIEYINSEEYNDILNRCVTVFNPNGGTCDVEVKAVNNGSAIGTLPTPVMPGNTFAGWYTADGTRITESTVLSNGEYLIAYAKWDLNAYIVSWTEMPGYKVTVNRLSSENPNAQFGELTNGMGAYYGDVLSIEYEANEGFDLISTGETSVTVTGDFDPEIISAVAEPKMYTVTWSNGTGYTINVERVASIYKNAPLGTLTSGSDIYYGDELKITYNASKNYKITANGATMISVEGNIGSETIYATADLNGTLLKRIRGTDSTSGRIKMDLSFYRVGEDLLVRGWIYDKNNLNKHLELDVNSIARGTANSLNSDCSCGLSNCKHGIDWFISKGYSSRIMVHTWISGYGDPIMIADF